MVGEDQGPSKVTEQKEEKTSTQLQKIKNRADDLVQRWRREYGVEIDEKAMKKIAFEYADLENDFEFVKETSRSVAVRYEEVSSCFPTLTEMDALISIVESLAPESKEDRMSIYPPFFSRGPKEERLQKLKKLRSAIKAMEG